MGNTQERSAAGSEQAIANQWIDYLKRKNLQLTFLWVFFLLLALTTSGLAAWSFWTKQQGLESLLLAESALAELEARNASMDEEAQVMSARLAELDTALQAAERTVASLQNSNGETGSQLDLTTRLVSALKQKIVSVESENSLLEEALIVSESKVNEALEGSRNYKKTTQEQRQSIAARKSAYDALAKRQIETQEEMQRLATELNEAKEREANLDQRNARLSKELKSSNAELRKVDAEKVSLEAKLKTLTMPIQTAGPSVSAPAIVRKPKVSELSQGATTSSAIVPASKVSKEEIGKKKEKKITVNPAPLDFDSIAVE